MLVLKDCATAQLGHGGKEIINKHYIDKPAFSLLPAWLKLGRAGSTQRRYRPAYAQQIGPSRRYLDFGDNANCVEKMRPWPAFPLARDLVMCPR